MDLYEHMGKDLFRAQGMLTPRGIVAFGPEDAEAAARELGGRSVVKIQVQVGGRGKGGGVELCETPEAAAAAADRMLGTDFKGFPVTRVLVEELLPIAREFYTSLLLDRSRGDYLAMMTAEGGVEIEELARTRAGGAPEDPHRPAPRPARLSRARAGGSAPDGGMGGRRRRDPEDVRADRRARRDPRRDQPAGPPGRRPCRGARRQGDDRRQRPVASPGHRGAGDPVPHRRRGGSREGEGPPVREARRRGRASSATGPAS